MQGHRCVFVLVLSCFSVFGLLLAPGTAGAQLPPDWVSDELIVGIRAGAARSNARAVYRSAGASLIQEIPQIGVHRLRVAPAALEAVELTLKRRNEFAFVERNRVFPPIQIPNDPSYGFQWHLPKIGAPAAWDLVPTASGVVIAILDSGVDPSHPDLRAKLISGINTYDHNTDTTDVFGHGTAVAGSAAAMGNNGIGVASVAWDSPIMPIRVTDTDGFAYTSTLAEGLVYAADNGASVMNLSFGGVAGSQAIRSAAQYAMGRGALVVAAAGNCGCFDSTPDNPYLLSVGATDRSDGLASFSSQGDHVDLAAPGVSILTTRRGGGYGYGSGTSFAAPVVAGVVALMFAANPDLTASEVESILESTADDLGNPGYDTSFGHGRVNAHEAVLAAGGDFPPTAAILSPDNGETVAGNISVEVSATDDDGIASIELYLDGILVGTDLSAPFGFSLNTMAQTDGSHLLEAVAYDTGGNSGASPSVMFVVDNPATDQSPPSITIKRPRDGSKVRRKKGFRVVATDDVQVRNIELYVDGALMASKSCGAAACSARLIWDAREAAKGPHQVQAVAYDAAGQVGLSPTITIIKPR